MAVGRRPPVRILVLRALGLGDLLTSVPALRGLRDAFPGSRIMLACPRGLHELVHVWGLAEQTVAVETFDDLPRRVSRPDLAANLHGRGPQSTRAVLATHPRSIVAFRHATIPETAALPAWRAHEREVDRWCRLLEETGIPASPARLHLTPPTVAGLEDLVGSTVVHPGASAPARRWPWHRWAVVAERERREGRRVVLTGSGRERSLCLRIAERAGVEREDVLAGRTTALELAAVVSRAGLVLSGDTGVAHLATAFSAPSVVLFGPTPPSEWGPPPHAGHHRVLWAGRRGDPHGAVTDPGLLSIETETVLEEIDSLRAGSFARVNAQGPARCGSSLRSGS